MSGFGLKAGSWGANDVQLEPQTTFLKSELGPEPEQQMISKNAGAVAVTDSLQSRLFLRGH